MKFKWFQNPDILQGRLIYVQQDYAFNFLPSSRSTITSLVIDTLQLSIDHKGRVLEVWGYCPYQSWQLAEIYPPNYIPGSVFVELEDIIPGVSEQIAGVGEWDIFVNSNTGWVCIEKEKQSPSAIAIEFASNSVAVLEENCLKAIWLHPENLPAPVV
ncbi:hypothetical protein [Laspinema olomoucense]|uniref:Uncharacterized protein n=1 Tax=Laspinema olomoucense D3b TaxID=2953688 RepID=A0ABT2NEW7_9CYAN|nr:hypothetical protein [Laspinema sp. D3b]MCT7981236.1 hypothetical protein [Laspinema sp. D3b]